MKAIVRKLNVLAALIVVFFVGGFLFSAPTEESEQRPQEAKELSDKNQTKTAQVNGPLTMTVKLQREYLDGDISEEVKKEKIWAMEDFWARYETWTLVSQTNDEITFKKKVNDISPLLKANGYFGISDNGTLTIFNGAPDKEEVEAIHTFFQIDVGKLEGTLHKQLMKGIPVKTKDHYQEVIETFKSYKVAQ